MASHSILTVDRSKKRKRSWRPWSDLPEDLLRPVVERLSAVDRIRFRAVCKDWLVSPIHNDIPKLPWILYYCFLPHHTICSFFEPCRKLPYIVEEKRGWVDERGWITAGSLLSGAKACASRCGWVLFSERTRRLIDSTLYHVYQHYVYHPLAKDIISLPRLELQQHNHHLEGMATFSSNPTSPDCVFVAPTVSDWGPYFCISTYSLGDKKWKTHNAHPHPYFFTLHAMAYMEGSVYCYNMNIGLSSFHIATQEWKLLSNESPSNNYWDFFEMKFYFVAYSGHLHLVYLGRSRVDKVPLCNIFRYNWMDGAWKKMESLDGGAMFLGRPSFGISAGEQTEMVANRVYYFCSHTSTPKFLVYGSAATGDKSEFSGNKIYCESWPEESKSLGQSTSCIWMEPPSFQC